MKKAYIALLFTLILGLLPGGSALADTYTVTVANYAEVRQYCQSFALFIDSENFENQSTIGIDTFAFPSARIGVRIVPNPDCGVESVKFREAGSYTKTSTLYRDDASGEVTAYFDMPMDNMTVTITMTHPTVTTYKVEGSFLHCDVTLSDGGQTGTDDFYAEAGKTITVTASPIEGHDIDSMFYTTLNNPVPRTVAFTVGADGTATGSFTMPADQVYLSVTAVQPPVPYISYDENGVSLGSRDCMSYTIVTGGNADYYDMDPGHGWYVVQGNVTMGSDTTIRVTGNVNLILCDGATLNANDGIYIMQGSSLSIYGQSEGTGKLIAKPESGPGIGGMADTVGGSLYVHGGVIDARGGTNAAGIGGGNHNSGYQNIVIYGGNVTAQGGSSGAGIGGGQQNNVSGTIEIYGGTVTATGGKYGAGIGGGEDRGGGTITIRGGTVKARGGKNAAGIGGGDHGVVGTVTISGGEVTSTGGDYGAGIGSGEHSDSSGSITFRGGKTWAYGGNRAAAIGGGSESDGQAITIETGDVFAACNHTVKKSEADYASGGSGIGGGEFGNAGTIRITGGIVDVRNEWTYCSGAGIGTGSNGQSGTIIISGGTVRSYASRGAGIGGGGGKPFKGTITITGGRVTATGKESAGIGGGRHTNFEGTVRISGGTVHATSSLNGAGIGAGAEAHNGDGGECKGTIEITGGTVTAITGGGGAQALGKGNGGDKTGTLILGNDLKVTSSTEGDGSGATVSQVLLRSVACRSRYARIEECDHPEEAAVYTMTASTHTRICPHCLTRFPEELHTLKDGPCEICHFNGEIVTITFDTDGGTAVDSLTVYAGSVAQSPDAPVKDGLEFQGWYQVTLAGNDEVLSEDPFDFKTPIQEAITLKAKWGGGCVVTFDADNGSAEETQTVGVGTAVTPPEDPTKEGFVFDGWYPVTDTGELAENAFSFDTIITESVTLKAKWRSLYTVTFDSDGGSAVDAQQVEADGNAVIPDAPTKEGYIFLGWYSVTDGVTAAEPYDFDETVTAALTLKAKWQEHVTVTLIAGSGSGEAVVISTTEEANWSDTPMRGKFVSTEKGVCFYVPDVPENFTAPQGQCFEGWLAEDRAYESGWALVPLDQSAYTLTARWAKHYSITWAETDSFQWLSAITMEASAGTVIDVPLAVGKELYDSGMRLHSLIITGDGLDPLIITTDRFDKKLSEITPIDANNGTMLYFTPVFTMPAADVTINASIVSEPEIPAFGIPDFTLPAGLAALEAEAFEGIAASVVDVPANCLSIGDHAFRNCQSLTQIRIPAGCALGQDVFDGCTLVYVYGTAGSSAEAYCQSHENCVFVPVK